MTLPEMLQQIHFAHTYTTKLLEATPRADWSRTPPAGVSHIGWQVGHLAMAAYRLALWRVWGRQPGDEALLDDAFIAQFSKGTPADSVLPGYPPIDDIFATYERVHARIQEELPSLPLEKLAETMETPHPIAVTRGDSLRWCAHHELTHAGQIGLLRRQLGHAPIW